MLGRDFTMCYMNCLSLNTSRELQNQISIDTFIVFYYKYLEFVFSATITVFHKVEP